MMKNRIYFFLSLISDIIRKILAIIVLSFKPTSQIVEKTSTVWPARWKDFKVIATGLVPISLLEINIIEIGFVEVKDTPHYKFLASQYQSLLYADYIKSIYKLENIDEQLYRFKRLHHEIRANYQNTEVLVRPKLWFSKKYIVIDGAHRIAILASIGLDKVRVKISF
jgi:uncharacterized membrane protein YukC